MDGNHTITNRNMLVGVDPIEEAKLVGLDRATTLNNGSSRYFVAEDKPYVLDKNLNNLRIPILLSSDPFADTNYTYQLEKLDLSIPDESEKLGNYMDGIKEKGGLAYLENISSKITETREYSSRKTYSVIFDNLLGEKDRRLGASHVDKSTVLDIQAGPLSYKTIKSPYPDKWPSALKVEPVDTTLPWAKERTYAFREAMAFFPKSNDKNKIPEFVRLDLDIIGAYDPKKLSMAKDPLTELPMETYRSTSAKLVLDFKGEPINPPVNLKGTNNPLDFLLQPPTALTTLEAAGLISEITGKKPISAIRVKIKGVDSMDEDAQNKLETIADDITKQTGLIADITLGTSPQSVLTYVPENKGMPALGWVEQPWIKLGAAFTIYKETKLGYSGIISAVLLVAIVYVFTTRFISYLTYRKQYALLLAVGWQLQSVRKMILLESIILGSLTAVIIWGIEAIAKVTMDAPISVIGVFISGLIGFLIYCIAGWLPARMALKIKPYEAIRTGETNQNMKRLLYNNSILSLAFQYLAGRMNRTMLSIFTLAVSVTLLILFLFITLRLKGVLYATYLGEYIAVEIGEIHYVAVSISLLIAILTTAEIMWQNVVERKPEIALLKALGWRNGTVRSLILYEGFLCGMVAGIISLLLSVLMIILIYHSIPYEHVSLLLFPVLIPAFAGMLGALIPSEMAVRISPAVGIKK
ncbi:ABC transporter permease [Bacillus sp. T33-2]|uniref:ABC transporter permease n=1 Tax=Bacillus sp. T33-2 TaxID=2054168 RepID=UPI001C60D570|nr:ABC transporter permease [Bacillus sp. T33-2]